MPPHEDTIIVFTAKSPERIIKDGGSQGWVLNPARAKQCTWLVCTQNRHNLDHEKSDATEPHGTGFLLAKVSAVRKASDGGPSERDRWLIAISAYARIDYPGLWDHGRNPVRYTSLEELGISLDGITLQPMPRSSDASPPAERPASAVAMLSIAEAKKALAATFGVTPDAVEITIRG